MSASQMTSRSVPEPTSSLPPESGRPSSIHFLVPVWGGDYLTTYLDVVLPTHLSPGNLPALDNRDDFFYQIFTNAECAALLEAHPAFAILKVTIQTAIELVDDQAGLPHEVMSQCYRLGIARANAVSAAVVFLTADAIFADGAFSFLWAKLNEGVNVVYCSGLRLTRAEMTSSLLPYIDDEHVISLPPRDMISLALAHLHTWTRCSFWDRDLGLNLLPSVLLWPAGTRGILACCFHLHPIMVRPEIKSLDFQSTIDDDYVGLVCPTAGGHYVVTDSDEMLCLELTEATRPCITRLRKGSYADVAKWAVTATTPHHRDLLKYQIRIHAGDVSAADWSIVEQGADNVVTELNRRIDERIRYGVGGALSALRDLIDVSPKRHQALAKPGVVSGQSRIPPPVAAFIATIEKPYNAVLASCFDVLRSVRHRVDTGMHRMRQQLLGPNYDPSWLNWRWPSVSALRRAVDQVLRDHCEAVTIISSRPQGSVLTAPAAKRCWTVWAAGLEATTADSAPSGDFLIELYLDDANDTLTNHHGLQWAEQHLGLDSTLVLVVQHSAGVDLLALGSTWWSPSAADALIPPGFELVSSADIGTPDHRMSARIAWEVQAGMMRVSMPDLIRVPLKIFAVPFGLVTLASLNPLLSAVFGRPMTQRRAADLWARVLVLRRSSSGQLAAPATT